MIVRSFFWTVNCEWHQFLASAAAGNVQPSHKRVAWSACSRVCALNIPQLSARMGEVRLYEHRICGSRAALVMHQAASQQQGDTLILRPLTQPNGGCRRAASAGGKRDPARAWQAKSEAGRIRARYELHGHRALGLAANSLVRPRLASVHDAYERSTSQSKPSATTTMWNPSSGGGLGLHSPRRAVDSVRLHPGDEKAGATSAAAGLEDPISRKIAALASQVECFAGVAELSSAERRACRRLPLSSYLPHSPTKTSAGKVTGKEAHRHVAPSTAAGRSATATSHVASHQGAEVDKRNEELGQLHRVARSSAPHVSVHSPFISRVLRLFERATTTAGDGADQADMAWQMVVEMLEREVQLSASQDACMHSLQCACIQCTH